MAESHIEKKEKKCVAKGQEKAKEKEKKYKAEGLSKKKEKEKHKVLMYAKGIRVKKKMMRSTKCLKKKRVICSMVDWIDFIVLHAYVVITCSCHWSLTTFHHSSFIISLPSNP